MGLGAKGLLLVSRTFSIELGGMIWYNEVRVFVGSQTCVLDFDWAQLLDSWVAVTESLGLQMSWEVWPVPSDYAPDPTT